MSKNDVINMSQSWQDFVLLQTSKMTKTVVKSLKKSKELINEFIYCMSVFDIFNVSQFKTKGGNL